MIYYADTQITVRDIREDDITALFPWWIDRTLNKHDPRPLPNDPASLIKECESYCDKFKREIMNEDSSLNVYKYFIITNLDDEPIGFINTFSYSENMDDAEMGIFIGDKSYWRKSIASRSMQIVMDHYFNEMNFKRLHIETGETNVSSIGLFEKLGFNKCSEDLEDCGFKYVVMEKLKDRLEG